MRVLTPVQAFEHTGSLSFASMEEKARYAVARRVDCDATVRKVDRYIPVPFELYGDAPGVVEPLYKLRLSEDSAFSWRASKPKGNVYHFKPYFKSFKRCHILLKTRRLNADAYVKTLVKSIDDLENMKVFAAKIPEDILEAN